MTVPAQAVSTPAPGTVTQPVPQAPQQQFVVPPQTTIVPEPGSSFPSSAAWAMAAPVAPAMPVQGQAPLQMPTQPAAPGGSPQQPGQQPAGVPQIPVDRNGNIMAAPGVRPELVGRPIAQLLNMYGVLADHARATMQQQPPQAPAPQPQPTQGQQPTVPRVQVPGMLTLEQVREVIREETQAAVGQATIHSRAQIASQSLASERFVNDPQVQSRMGLVMQGLPQQAFADPTVWQNAYNQALGSLVREGYVPQASQQPQQQPAGQQPSQNPPFQNGAGQIPVTTQALNGGQMWVPQAAFTEPPNGGNGSGAVPQQLTAQQLQMAQKMNMDPQMYAQWLGGQPGGIRA